MEWHPPGRDQADARPPGGTPAPSGEADLAKRRGAGARSPATVGDMDGRSFAVTLVKVGSGLPLFEIGAYTYTSDRLPSVGETIVVSWGTGGAAVGWAGIERSPFGSGNGRGAAIPSLRVPGLSSYA